MVSINTNFGDEIVLVSKDTNILDEIVSIHQKLCRQSETLSEGIVLCNLRIHHRSLRKFSTQTLIRLKKARKTELLRAGTEGAGKGNGE